MAQVIVTFLLLLSLSGTFCKYVYIDQGMNWYDAWFYCWFNYIDLAPVSNEEDNIKLMELFPSNTDRVWFGLRKNRLANTWMWSAGGNVTQFFWDAGEPDNSTTGLFGSITNKGKWHDEDGVTNRSFICFDATVVQKNKTWEEALEYCRKQYNDLASVASVTETMLIQRELKNQHTTEHVWIGLRFLSGDWLWVDGQEMDYEAWGPGGRPSCPNATMKCGGLQVAGGSVWMAHDCEERLNFICY